MKSFFLSLVSYYRSIKSGFVVLKQKRNSRHVWGNYRLLGKWQFVFCITFITVIAYNGFYYFHPSNQRWMHSDGFSWLNLFQFLFIDQALIECITCFIIFQSIKAYAYFFSFDNTYKNVKSTLFYLLKFLPLFLIVYFLFAPITLSVRYLYHYIIGYPSDNYFNEYFFLNKVLYFTYLVPVIIMGYTGLLFNFKWRYVEQKPIDNDIPRLLLVKDEIGEISVPVKNILWISRDGRKYKVKTGNHTYFTNKTLNELEDILKPDNFFRINRSSLVPFDNIRNYSFWENDKYILRTKDDNEFIISRERIKVLKTFIKSISIEA